MDDKILQALLGQQQQQGLEMPSYMGMSMMGQPSQDPVQDYLRGSGAKHGLASIVDALVAGGSGAGGIGALLTGHPFGAAALGYLGKQNFDSMNANSDASQRFMQGAQGFENTGLPGRPGVGRFATMPPQQ